MDIAIYGIGGKMGRTLLNMAPTCEDVRVVCGVDLFADPSEFDLPVYKSIHDSSEHIDCIIDFSVHDAIFDILPFAIHHGIACVLATTGHNEHELQAIEKAAEKIPTFKTGNMSIGINTLSKLVELAAGLLDTADIEIVEMHHNQKVDAPSGTALMLASAAEKARGKLERVTGRSGLVGKRSGREIGIHAVRGGSVVGKHSVMFMQSNEVITLTHEAESKAVFASGALDAAKFITGKEPGIYDMNDLLKAKQLTI
ncbi:MAG: 4-hydroxy-tetrahydrodipicolinate reductase [Christensenellaceae bacterium]|jgi:4-hydroxy-tetrahydrodipicolinate reductase|nr:4-hydroxy-tetrahydrodipicolinate reductase [Christensenellaceae bacterium]